MLFKKANYLMIALIIIGFSLNVFSTKIALQKDFADSLTGWTVIDSSGVGAIWVYSQTPPINFVTNVGSSPGFTTASNGYMMVDSDDYGTSNQHTELVSPRIDCSNLGEVILEFEQNYQHYPGASTSVWVKTEASNYIEFTLNTGMAQDEITANPELITIDLSAMAAGKDSVYIKFVWKGDWSWWWAIDDIVVFDPEKYNASVINIGKSKIGTILPLQQSKSLNFTNDVANIGIGTMTNVEVLYNIYNSSFQIVYEDSAVVDSISPGDTVAFQTNVGFNAAYADTYFVEYYVSSDQSDIDATNDQDTLWFAISDSTYARDNGGSNVGGGVGFPGGTGSFGNVFQLYKPDTLTSISFFLASDKSGDQTSFTIHEWSGDTTVAVVYDVPAFTLTSATFNQWATVDNLNVALEAKEYLVVINQITSDSNISIGADMNTAEEQLVGSPSWTVYTTFGAPLLRPNFGDICRNLSVTQTVTDIDCKGNSSGKIDLNVSGGNSGFSYSWSHGAASKNVSSLALGIYTVTVTDAMGCMAMASDSILEPSSAVSFTIGFVDATCAQASGSASITATGGTSPYTYNWSNGATASSISSIMGGEYSVIVSDNNGCQEPDTIVVDSGTVIQIATTNISHLSCYGDGNTGSITVDASGSTGSYTYSWSTSNTTATISGLVPGNYTVTAFDAGVCFNNKAITINEPDSITINLTPSAASCFQGSDGGIISNVSGGTAGYTYSWNNSETTADLSSVGAGDYTLDVTDANSCLKSKSTTVGQPEVLVLLLPATINASSDTSNDGAATVSPSGGTTPYSYNWSNGAITDEATSLSAGDYTITVTDANDCQESGTVTVLADSTISILEWDISEDLIVYPNPTSYILNVHFNNTMLKDATLSLYNMTGEIVLKQEVDKIEMQLDLSNFTKGIYLLRINNGHYIGSRKIEVF